MHSLLNSIHFWTLHDDVNIKPTDYNAYKNSTQNPAGGRNIHKAKLKYTEKRNYHLTIHRKIKDKFKDFDDVFKTQKLIAHYLNRDNSELSLMFSRGLLASIKFDDNKLRNIIAINFERTLCTKLQQSDIVNGVITSKQAICITNSGKLMNSLGATLLECGNKRNLILDEELLVVWGKSSQEIPQPWSPLTKEHQRANLHVYWLGNLTQPDLLTYKKTDGEILNVVKCLQSKKSIIIIEQKVNQRCNVFIELEIYDLIDNTLKLGEILSVSLPTQSCSVKLADNQKYLAVACIDGTLSLLNLSKKSTQSIKLTFIPQFLTWNTSSSIFLCCNQSGVFQYYDFALNLLNVQLIGDDFVQKHIDLSSYMSNGRVSYLCWLNQCCVICFEHGPLCFLRFDAGSVNFPTLIQIYLNTSQVNKAIKLMLNTDFDKQTFHCLERIVTHLLRKKLTTSTAKHLQDALGCFHSPAVPLSPQIRHKYGLQVKSLTRRFFHQLLRAKMYETAFLLAVDLGHHDLFMDLYYIAVKIGETELAAAARAQASALLSRCSSEASNCCSCSYTSTSSSQEDDDHDAYNIPPIPNLPKIKLQPPSSTPIYQHHQQTPIINKPPPLPITTPPLPTFQPPPPQIKSKQQAKVKFSDTVTAFIVPEVKRPMRVPPLPPHVTDPAKELADSLPLCHPNEEYLKDFAPIRRDDDDDDDSGQVDEFFEHYQQQLSTQQQQQQQKIKVVHFGVV